VAIVDAYAYPNAAADLAIFRNAVGLPPCTQQNGCLTIIDQRGNRAPPHNANTNWDVEQAADLDTVSTMCPNCRILLVQAETSFDTDLATAERTAGTFHPHVIANSYGGPETGTTRVETAYDQPGIAITASTGDFGYGVAFPASSPHVTAVGGTTLNLDSNGARLNETAWAGAGSGCSTVYNEPSWQTPNHANMANNGVCTMRMIADVSADADPNTGVVFYMNIPAYPAGFYIVGGTSISNQIIAGIYGERANAVTFGENPYLAPSTALNDVTSGSNGTCAITYYCNSVPGYDGPTGLGTPNGDTAF
jgi:subtilase family serine protease